MAIADVKEIKEYIAQDSPDAAKNMVKAIYSKIEKLSDFPEMGASLSTRIDIKTDYRYLTCGLYIIFYKIEGDFVSIYRILNGARDYMSILFEKELKKN
jgi:addiction module RelE/StbE family toxin